MVRVLVAGGLGFIGSNLVDRLLERRDISECVVVDNLWTGLEANLAHVFDPRLRIVIGSVEDAPLEGQFDEIYHLASPASPRWYMDEPRRTISANIVGAMRLLDLLTPEGQIAYSSTSEVYGDPLVSPQPETYRGSVDCTGPRAAYDEGKRCTEALLFEAHRTAGVRVKVVRLFNVFGPRTRVDDGRAVSNFVTQALRGLPITVYGDGVQSRSWGYIDDIVEGLARYFWRDGVDYPGPVNIGNDREIPVIEVAQFIQGRFPHCSIVHMPPAPQDPTNRRPDLSVANRIIPGWACSVEYEEGVERTISWFASQLGVAAFSPIIAPAKLVAELGAGTSPMAAPTRLRGAPRHITAQGLTGETHSGA